MSEAIHGSNMQKKDAVQELRKSFPLVRKSDIEKLVSKCVDKFQTPLNEANDKTNGPSADPCSIRLKVDPKKVVEQFGGNKPEELKEEMGYADKKNYKTNMNNIVHARESGILPNFGGNIGGTERK